MKASFNILILCFIVTAFCADIFRDLAPMKVYHSESSQSDRVPINETDSPICIDSDTNEILNWNPKSEAEHISFDSDLIYHREPFQLSTYSLVIWQPPKLA
jgi:hypothetical protein